MSIVQDSIQESITTALVVTPHDEAGQRSARPGGFKAALFFGGVTGLAAKLGATSTRPGLWYRLLRKSRARPPRGVFAPVWTALYAAMAYSAWRVWRAPDSPERSRALRLWGVQLGLNAAWSPAFFKAQSPKAALGIVVALLPTLARYIRCAAKVDRLAARIMLPYLAWSGFASYLNGSIVSKNHTH